MALLTEPGQRDGGTHVREDVGDTMIIIDAKATPLCSMIPKSGTTGNTLFEWPVDAYAAATVNTVVDGDVVAYDGSNIEDHAENRSKLQGRTSYQRRKVGVGKVANTVSDVAGVGKGKEFAHAKAKKLIELKRDMETTLLGEQESRADDGATLGNTTRGLAKWVQTGAQTDLPVPAAFRNTADQIVTQAAVTDITEENLNDQMEATWDITGQMTDYHCFCKGAFQRQITSYLDVSPLIPSDTSGGGSTSQYPLRQFNGNLSEKTITLAVNVYVGDFGTVHFHPDNFMPANTWALFVDMDKVSCRSVLAPGYEDVDYNGSGPRGVIDAIYGLQVDDPRACFKSAAA